MKECPDIKTKGMDGAQSGKKIKPREF